MLDPDTTDDLEESLPELNAIVRIIEPNKP